METSFPKLAREVKSLLFEKSLPSGVLFNFRWQMANAKPGIRHLYTQQCRLRHILSICGRNVILHPATLNSDATLKLGFYFTLHAAQSTEAFYTSETIYDIANLNWKSFNWSQFSETTELSLISVIVKLCAKSENCCLDNNEIILTRTICFKQLHYIGEQIPKGSQHFPLNTLVFEMFEGFYSERGHLHSKEKATFFRGGTQLNHKILRTKPVEIEVDASSVRLSYDLSTLKRVHTVQRAIKQTRASVFRVRNVIHEKLATTEIFLNKCAERECLVSRLNLLRDEFEGEQKSLKRLKQQCLEMKQKNEQKQFELGEDGLTLKKNFHLLMEHRRNLNDEKENLVKTLAHLNRRRRQLISELAGIYPIEEVDKKFTICGVHLPNSEDFAGCDETMISVALGFVCQLVSLIGHFLHVPPRYPTIHYGTRSRIYDYFLSNIPETEREFPLFIRGRDKLHFKYGVFLLNKNISQLRFHCNLTTIDLRQTLPNLKTLIELRLINRIDPLSPSSLGMQQLVNVGTSVKQVIVLSEDPDGSSDNSALEGQGKHSSTAPVGNLPGPLSLSLDHGLDEIEQNHVTHQHSQVARPLLGRASAAGRQAKVELRSSEPFLAGKGLSCNGTEGVGSTDIPSVAMQKMLIPLQGAIYGNESESEEAFLVETWSPATR